MNNDNVKIGDLSSLPANKVSVIKAKLLDVTPEVIDGFSCKDLRAWRVKAPTVSQDCLAVALGVTRANISQNETGQNKAGGKGPNSAISNKVKAKLIRLRERFVSEVRPSLVGKNGETPEEEFAEALGMVRRVYNTYRPMMGTKQLNETLEQMLESCNQHVMTIYPQAIKLARSAKATKEFF